MVSIKTCTIDHVGGAGKLNAQKKALDHVAAFGNMVEG
jgi:hypothetical protein